MEEPMKGPITEPSEVLPRNRRAYPILLRLALQKSLFAPVHSEETPDWLSRESFRGGGVGTSKYLHIGKPALSAAGQW